MIFFSEQEEEEQIRDEMIELTLQCNSLAIKIIFPINCLLFDRQ